jgi:hypothetical protein
LQWDIASITCKNEDSSFGIAPHSQGRYLSLVDALHSNQY